MFSPLSVIQNKFDVINQTRSFNLSIRNIKSICVMKQFIFLIFKFNS